MNNQDKLLLQEMIKANNVEDQTNNIRNLKHSQLIKNDVKKLLNIMKETNDHNEIHIEAMIECSFIFTYYTDIYNKIRKSEINLDIFYQFLDVLSKIEDGLIDQHEGSFEIGTLLKKIYIDSALKKAEKLNEKTEPVEKVEPKNVCWKTFKKT